MALVYDSAHSPAQATQGGGAATTISVTTASFTPPDGAILIIEVYAGQYASQTWTGITVTDNLGAHLTYSSPLTANGQAGSAPWIETYVYWAYAGATSPGAMTISATATCAAGNNMFAISVNVRCWTGAKTSGPIGVSSVAEGSGTPLTVNLTPNATGSALCLAAQDTSNSDPETACSAGANCYIGSHSLTEFYDCIALWFGTSGGPTLTTDLTSKNLILTDPNTAPVLWQYVGYEILAATGGADTTPPSVPGTPTISNPTSSTLDAAWTASTDDVAVTGYDVLITGPL